MKKTSDRKVLSITPSLKNRKAINDALNKINKRKKISFDELDLIGDELTLLGEKASVNAVIKNFLEISDENVLMRYLYIFEYLNFDEFVNPLIFSILKRELSDSFKANAINALYSFDIDISSPIFTKILKDSDKMFYSFDKEFFSQAENDEETFINALSWFTGLPYHKKMVVLNKLSDINNEMKVIFLEIIANDKDTDLALRAIDILSSANEPGALSALKRLKEEYKDSARSERAIRGLKKQKLLGIKKNETEYECFNENAYTCYVSMIDSNGNYVLWVAANNDLKPPLEVLCILINEEEGIIDCFGSSQMTKKEFSSLIKKAKDEDYFIKIDFNFCLTLLKNALHCTKVADGILPLEFLYRKKIFKKPLPSKKYTPKFDDYDLESIKNDEALLKKTPAINDICGINSWTLLASNIFSYAEKFIEIKKKFSASAKKLKTEKLIEKIFHHLVLPELEVIVKRLFFAADILKYDKKNKKYVKLILCAAENLIDPAKKPIKNPFLTDFILSNVKNAAEIFKHQ